MCASQLHAPATPPPHYQTFGEPQDDATAVLHWHSLGAAVYQTSRDGKSRFLYSSSHWFLRSYEYYTGVHHIMRQKYFLRAVYGYLTVAVFTALAICTMCIQSEVAQGFLVAFPHEFYVAASGLGFMGVLLLFVVKDWYPWNKVGLVMVTLTISAWLGIRCALDPQAAHGILQAECVLLLLYGTQTVLASLPEYKEMGVSMCTIVAISCWAACILVFGWHAVWAFSLLFTVAWCGFVVYDVHQIMKKYGYEDPVIATIELYLDPINVILFLLQEALELISAAIWRAMSLRQQWHTTSAV